MQIKFADIDIAASPVVRARIDQETVEDYSEAYKSGVKMPRPVVFQGERILLADGRHRIDGARLAGLSSLDFQVEQGGYPECVTYALSANHDQGLRRTNADKRKCVELAVLQWPGKTQEEIAKICCVTRQLVSAIRKESMFAVTNEDLPRRKHKQSLSPMPARHDKEGPPVEVHPPPKPPIESRVPLVICSDVRVLIDQVVKGLDSILTDPSISYDVLQKLRPLVTKAQRVQVLLQPELPGLAEAVPPGQKSRGTLEQIRGFFRDPSIGLPQSDADWFFYKCQGCGWKNNGKAIVDWRATVVAWQLAKFFPSQKQTQTSNGFGRNQGQVAPQKSLAEQLQEKELRRADALIKKLDRQDQQRAAHHD